MCLLYRLDSAARDIAAIFDADPGLDPWPGDYVAPGKFAPVVVQGKEFWVGTLRHTEFRCLVPVTSFMEWGGVKGARTQHWFSVPSEPVFAFAGIWRDNDVPSFAFLTCDPNPLVAAVHDKSMPVILNPWDYDRWLNADWAEARGLVDPFPSQLMAEARVPPRAPTTP
jgi:putative SOS response-associated peptidase YedK